MKRSCRAVLWILLASSLSLSAQSVTPVAGNSEPAATMPDAPSAIKADVASSVATRAEDAQQAAPTLPDAPSATPAKPTEPASAAPKAAVERKVADLSYWAVNGVLFSSSIAYSETLVRCTNCTFLSDQMHRRGVSYGAGFAVDAGAAYLGYYLKKNGHRWWFVPAAALTAANAFLAYHWAVNTN